MKTGIFLPPGRFRPKEPISDILARLGTSVVFSSTTADSVIKQWWDSDVDALAVLPPHTDDQLTWQIERLRRIGIANLVQLQPIKT